MQFIAIVTFGRSGSTALQAVLNAHPEVLVRGENYNALTGLWQYWNSLTDAASRHRSGKPTHPWFGTARLNAISALEGIRHEVLNSVLRPKPSTRWSGFKEVRYEQAYFPTTAMLVSYLVFLQELLPGLRYLVNTRDPDSAALSGWWQQHPDAHGVLAQTNQQLRTASDALTRLLGSDRIQLIDYGHWRNDPHVVLRALENIGFQPNADIVHSTLGNFLTHGQGQANGS